MTTYYIIANPVSGSGAGLKAIPKVEEYLTAQKVDFRLVKTEYRGQGIELAREAAADFDVVVALGGDGTANEVVNGLVAAKDAGQGQAALGILGAGRGNDFAHTLGMPVDLEQACDALLAGSTRPIDIGRVIAEKVPDGRYFCNCVGVGFDAITTIEAAKLPRLGGFLSFLVAVLRTILLYNNAPVSTVDYDGQTISQSSLMVSIMNGRRLGGGFWMAPESQPDDGLFDLCIARQVSRRRVLTLVPYFMKGTQESQPEITTGRASSITISSEDGALPAQTDGEIISVDGDRLEIELLPLHLEAICGPPETAA